MLPTTLGLIIANKCSFCCKDLLAYAMITAFAILRICRACGGIRLTSIQSLSKKFMY